MNNCWITLLRWWHKKLRGWRSGPGEEAVMAKLIQFYVPAAFQPPKTRWTPAELRGKIIAFQAANRKSA
jgi:hypothetical protein